MNEKIPNLRLREVNRAEVQQLIEREYDSLAGIVLRLAWQLGLTRQEIHHLQWRQFSADFFSVAVDGRTIPVENSVRLFFDALSEGDTATAREWVVVSAVTKAPVSEQYISMLATKALCGIGMDDIKLSDLRSDYVLRQMEKYPLEYVAQISNLQYFTLQTIYLPFLQALSKKQAIPPAQEVALREVTPEKIEQVIEVEHNSTFGTILNLAWNTEIPVGAIAELQWQQVNLEEGYLCIDEKRYCLTEELRKRLWELRRQAGQVLQSNRVFLSTRTRKPMNNAYISRMARELFVKNGLYGMTLAQAQLMKQEKKKKEKLDAIFLRILPLFEKMRNIQSKDVSETLDIDEKIGASWLLRLEQGGRLKRYGKTYYLAEEGHWSEAYPECICEYIRMHPGCTRVELEIALGAPHRSAQPHLAKLIREEAVRHEGKRLYYNIEP